MQIGWSILGNSTHMSKYWFVRVRISIFTSKISSGIWSRFEADPGGWQWLGTGKEVTLLYALMFVQIKIC